VLYLCQIQETRVSGKRRIKMAKSRAKGYFGLGQIISLILCFFLGWPLGVIERLLRGKILGAILALIFPIFWLIDFITLILFRDLTILA